MSKVSKKYFIYGVLTGIIVVFLMLLGLYQLPSVKRAVDWRFDIMAAFVRGVFNPVASVPAPESITDDVNRKIDMLILDPVLTTVAPDNDQMENDHASQAATLTPTVVLTKEPVQLPVRVILESPAYESQDWNNCGPVTLSHYLRYYGWDGDQFDISDQIKPDRADRNVNVDELIGYVSENVPWLEALYRVGGDLELIKSMIASGYPVMIEESFYLEDRYWFNDDRWSGHYMLITGYDNEDEVFIAQDPMIGPDQEISYKDLKNNWQAFNNVYLLVYQPDEQDNIRALLDANWDVDKNRQLALEKSENETRIDADNAFAWFNLATNMLYFDQYEDAAQAYDESRTIGLPQRMFRYQFGPFIAYFQSGRNEELQTIVDYALQVTPNSEEALLWQGWVDYRLGKKQAALSSFQNALEVNPDYDDAIYALNYVMNN